MTLSYILKPLAPPPVRPNVSRTGMRLELQFTKSGRKFRLWHPLLAVAILAFVCGLLPERVGAPIVFGFICLCVVTIIVCVVLLVVQKFRRK
jgi:undecaprenyl pyrophosphate phosphatase UppP